MEFDVLANDPQCWLMFTFFKCLCGLLVVEIIITILYFKKRKTWPEIPPMALAAHIWSCIYLGIGMTYYLWNIEARSQCMALKVEANWGKYLFLLSLTHVYPVLFLTKLLLKKLKR